ncbi:MAG: class I adenylate-forming enzyme family protein [Hoeflea sp. D1-CHI-28]
MTLPDLQDCQTNACTGDLLDGWARQNPGRLAVVDRRGALTYAQLREAVDRCAAAMLRDGVKLGDRVAVLAPQRFEVMVTFLAASRIGAIWLGLNPKYKLPELSYLVDDAQPTILITVDGLEGRDFSEEVAVLRGKLSDPGRVIWFENAQAGEVTFAAWTAGEADESLARRRDKVDAHCASMLVYTSGSSGRPKGVLLRQRELIFRSRVQNRMFPVTPCPRLLNPLPINHIGGMHYLSFYTFVGGGTLYLSERFSTDEFIEAITSGKINAINTLPTMFQMIAEHPDFTPALLDRLDLVVYSGGVLPQPLVEMLIAAKCQVGVTYGMSETCGSVTYARKSEASLDVLLNSIGRPTPEGDVRVADSDGNICGPGETGDNQVRRDYCMCAYLGRPDATKQVFTEDGWLHTGDQAAVRDDGYLEFVGRLSEMFKSGGYNVYPREIELALADHPDIDACAVVGVPDEMFGEVGWAWVERAPGRSPDADTIKSWAKERLANYKVPKRFVFVDRLPLLPIGKVDKMRLRHEAVGSREIVK